MGIFDFLRNEFIEVIDWVETDPTVVLHKFPDKGADIKYGAALTVRPSQVALFVNEGVIADVFTEGLYALETQNLPLLTKLRNWQMGFKSPFKCDIYFISLKNFTQFKWGTPAPVIMRDNQFGQVRVKAFGTYMLKVSDPVKFFKHYSGNRLELSQSDIEDSMRDLISPRFGEALAEANISVMDLVSNLSEIGLRVLPNLLTDFQNFGLEITRFVVTSISLPPDVEAFYDKITNMNMVKDMDQLTRFEASQAIGKAAENSGSAGTLLGMNVGTGLGQVMGEIMKPSPEKTNSADNKDKIMETIRELGKLKAEGFITEEEFESKKKELLSRL
jgi:membrane protease subunit (stomatin/prohibitin family)